MDITTSQLWIQDNPLMGAGAILLLSVTLFLIARGIIARALIYIADRTETKYDDILVKNVRPFRLAWLAPLLAIYGFAYLVPDYRLEIEKFAILLIIWVVAITMNAVLSAANEMYEGSPGYSGVSIGGYLDLIKILVLIVAFILSISLLTEESPLGLLTGLGAVMAILLLVFRDTILAIVASVQISAHDLVKEGDWIEVPAYSADGDVINMSLHTIKVQNFDKTISVIPTHKMVEVAYKNWRGMQESGGRRIKRSLSIDMASIKFCDSEMIERFRRIELLSDFLNARDEKIQEGGGQERDALFAPGSLTNATVFRTYIAAYLNHHTEIYSDGMTFLVRQLASGPTGLPLEIYVFTKTIVWTEYEAIQAEIFDHLIAAVPYFDLRVFQEPTGSDFAAMGSLT